MSRKKSVGRYSVTAPGIDKQTDSAGGAIIFAQRACEQGQAETVYVRDTLGDVVARVENREGVVFTFSGHSVRT